MTFTLPLDPYSLLIGGMIGVAIALIVFGVYTLIEHDGK